MLNYSLFHKKKEVITFHNPYANPAVKYACNLHLTCTWHDIIDIGMCTSYKQVSDYQYPHMH